MSEKNLDQINAEYEASRYGHIYEDKNSAEYREAMARLKGLKFNPQQIQVVMSELRTGLHKFNVDSAIRALQAGERENRGR